MVDDGEKKGGDGDGRDEVIDTADEKIPDRTFAFQIPSVHGSATWMSANANDRVEHAILPLPDPIGPRYSIVLRCLSHFKTLGEIIRNTTDRIPEDTEKGKPRDISTTKKKRKSGISHLFVFDVFMECLIVVYEDEGCELDEKFEITQDEKKDNTGTSVHIMTDNKYN